MSILPSEAWELYTANVKKALNVIILCSVWLGVSIPLLFALFFFSSSKLRRKPIFIFNALSITIGVTMGILNIFVLVPTVINPIVPINRPAVQAYAFFSSSTPIFVESILVFRLLAVFPFTQTPGRIFYPVFIPLALLKVARIANLIEFSITYGRLIRHATSSAEMGALAMKHAGPKIEWILQVIDNTAASALFIWRLSANNCLFPVRRSDSTVRLSYSAQISTLFWIAISNFIFPVIVSITLLVIYFRETDYINMLMFFICNAYIEIIGVLLATVWVASNHWQCEGGVPTEHPRMSSLRFDGGGYIYSISRRTAADTNHGPNASISRDENIGIEETNADIQVKREQLLP